MNRTFKFQPTIDFILNERGKIRYVSGDVFRDRLVKRAYCDNVLSPNLRKYQIYDDGASISGKGMGFTRRRIETHLHRYYREHGSNRGYILLMDYVRYYDNLRHDVIRDIFGKLITMTDLDRYILDIILERSKIDVSYMDDKSFADCLNQIFNSLDYHRTISSAEKTGEKFMEKHLNIGDHVSQVVGVIYPMRIDNFIKIKCGMKYYGRYVDDSYVISDSKETLWELFREIQRIGAEIGIRLNERKSRIVPLDSMWRFLQINYSLTDTGRVVHKINPERLHRMRKKLRKLAGVLSDSDYDQLYKSWFNSHKIYMSRAQRETLELEHGNLKEVFYHDV